jgi:flagellar basal-body rod protein FlgF
LTRGLYTAASGMLARQIAIDACANNLANINTAGYKRDRTLYHDFEDMTVVRLYDSPDGPRLPIPMPATTVGRLGTGTYVEDVSTAFDSQGALELTDRPLDVALQGPGYLVVQTAQGERYTRAGQMFRRTDGTLTNVDGLPYLGANGPIVLPGGATNEAVSITEDGDVCAGKQVLDRLRVVTLGAGARKLGYSLVEAANATDGATGTTFHQRYLEQSTVNGIRETVELIEIQRAYEAGQKLIEASDDSLGRLFEQVAS